MEFNEKLQKLRTGAGLTQEQLAEKLYVSRTAVSKWESGRGYPGIDSLKAIAKYFHVTIDDLICGEEMITLAEQDIRASKRKNAALVCGVLDCLAVLLFFLPVFGEGGSAPVASVPLPQMTAVSGWLKITFAAAVGLTALTGFAAVVLGSLEKPAWRGRLLAAGMALSVAGTLIFVLARQPYAGAFYLCLLVVKGFLIHKSR